MLARFGQSLFPQEIWRCQHPLNSTDAPRFIVRAATV
jgi:hypothetical protein